MTQGTGRVDPFGKRVLKKGKNRGVSAAIDSLARLLLVALPLQQFTLLVFAHLLAALLDHTTQRVSPLLRGASLVLRARQGLET
jgi:hypothetical protein